MAARRLIVRPAQDRLPPRRPQLIDRSPLHEQVLPALGMPPPRLRFLRARKAEEGVLAVREAIDLATSLEQHHVNDRAVGNLHLRHRTQVREQGRELPRSARSGSRPRVHRVLAECLEHPPKVELMRQRGRAVPTVLAVDRVEAVADPDPPRGGSQHEAAVRRSIPRGALVAMSGQVLPQERPKPTAHGPLLLRRVAGKEPATGCIITHGITTAPS